MKRAIFCYHLGEYERIIEESAYAVSLTCKNQISRNLNENVFMKSLSFVVEFHIHSRFASVIWYYSSVRIKNTANQRNDKRLNAVSGFKFWLKIRRKKICLHFSKKSSILKAHLLWISMMLKLVCSQNTFMLIGE